MNKIYLLIICFVLLTPVAKAQKVAVKTNLLYGAYTFTPNLGMEIDLGHRSTLDVNAGYNPWNLKGSEADNKKLVHWLANIEYRYWLCQTFKGHFFGAHILGSQYNISQKELPLLLGKESKDYRYDGWAAGVGISYGYQFLLGRHLNLETSIGAGYAYLKYDKYNCYKCGEKVGNSSRNYFGPTKAAVSLIYIF